jgi:lysophospholipase L1-like esterase
MADWLAYGLEEAFAERPELAVLRRHRTGSGLIRYDTRRDVEWAQIVKETIAADKPKLIVMMIGTNDRQQIRERTNTPAGAAAPAKPGRAEPAPLDPELQAQQSADEQNARLADPPPAAPTAPEQRSNQGPFEFHTEKWEAAYVRRIDATIAAMKSAGVPVFWVGLPPQRVTRASTDSSYLNEIYRQQAEKAGITYIDVWDGFVDEGGRFTYEGPDFEGQTRRLRSGDGVYFTKAGGRKLAHYVEREITRVIANRAVPVALPAPEPLPGPAGARPGGASGRPLAGPVVPLTVSTGGSDELLGAPRSTRAAVDPIAAKVLTRGEPVAAPYGRADDFGWPRGAARPTATGGATAALPAPQAVPAVAPPPSPVQPPSQGRDTPARRPGSTAQQSNDPQNGSGSGDGKPAGSNSGGGASPNQQRRPRAVAPTIDSLFGVLRPPASIGR